MNPVYSGCLGGWGVKGGLYHTLEQKSIHCVLMEVQKEAQEDRWKQPSLALLVHPSGTVHIYKVIDMMPVKADPAICSSVNGVSG